MSDETTREDLRKASEYMAEHGHAKHHYITDTGQVCMLGAIGRVTGALVVIGEEDSGAPMYEWDGDARRSQAAQKRLMWYLNKDEAPGHALAIPTWNDEVLSAEDAILSLKRAGEED